VAVKGLLNPGSLPQWALILLLFIGVVGFVVDSVIVYQTYIKKATHHPTLILPSKEGRRRKLLKMNLLFFAGGEM